MLIAGQEAPLLGRVCMDQCIIDVTHIAQEVRMGDEVVLIGRQGPGNADSGTGSRTPGHDQL